MIFDLNNYTHGRYAMHCPSYDKARVFLRYLHDNGKCWRGGESYLAKDNFCEYYEKTCYAFSEGTYADLNYFLHESDTWKLLFFDDFDWEGFNNREIELTERDTQKFNTFMSMFYIQ